MRISVVLALLMTAGACSHAERDIPVAGATKAVSVDTASIQPLRQALEAGGVIEARTTAVITSRIVAPVVAVHVAAGDRVRAGQPLVQLDARDLHAHQERATASAEALNLTATATAAERDAAEAAVVLARATHGRISTLHERRSATTHELDEAVAALRGAEARLRALDARVAETQAGRRSAHAAAEAAAVAASFAVLTAPFDGIVTEKLAEPGNLAGPGVPLLRVEDARGFRLEVRVDASRTDTVKVGDVVDVLLDHGNTHVPLLARVAEVARAVNAGSQVFVVKIDLPSSPAVRSGTFARARFTGDPREVLTVSTAAVVTRGQLPTVFIVHENRARMRVVNTGQAEGGRVEILAGVAAGEVVIAPPQPDLRDGDAVQVGPRAAAARGAL